MGILRQVAEYLYIKKRNPEEKPNKWTGYMHSINRLSIFLFIVALIIIIFKLFIRKS